MLIGLLLSMTSCTTISQGEGQSEDVLMEERHEEGESEVEIWSEEREALEDWYFQVLDMDVNTEDPREYGQKMAELMGASQGLSNELEAYFEGSDGDRDVFGWMMVRRSRLYLNLGCLHLNFPVPENTPPQRREEIDESLLLRAEGLRDAASRSLGFAKKEGSEPWVSIAEEWALELDDEGRSVHKVCADHFEAIRLQ